jgi:histidinol-phosphate aminotransferase
MLALSAFSPPSLVSFRAKVDAILQKRAALLKSLAELREARLGVGVPLSQPHANFVLVPILARSSANGTSNGRGKQDDIRPDNVRAKAVYLALAEPAKSDEERVVVRFRGNEVGCEACLRITVGTERENEVLVRRLREILEKV